MAKTCHDQVHPGSRLRELMKDHCIAAPGAFNGLVARAIADAGFEAAYVSGGATSVVAGVPDVGVLTLDHFSAVVREVASSSSLPVIADADTGFGEEEMVRRTVLDYNHAGAAGLHIEDQVFPKRCGHLDGKALVSIEQAVSKITWAVEAAHECSGADGFLVCARTDAKGVEGFDAALERARAYVQAGASMIFPEGLHTRDEFAKFAAELGEDCYLLANMTEFGKTPMISLSEFEQMGYHIVIYPVSLLRIAMGAVVRGLGVLKEEGSLEPLLGEMQSRQALYDMVRYTPGTPWKKPVG